MNDIWCPKAKNAQKNAEVESENANLDLELLSLLFSFL